MDMQWKYTDKGANPICYQSWSNIHYGWDVFFDSNSNLKTDEKYAICEGGQKSIVVKQSKTLRLILIRITISLIFFVTFHYFLDKIGIDSECPRNKDLPVLKEGLGKTEDQFYCAFTWDKKGDEEPMRACNGQKRIWMDGENYNGQFAANMVPTGSVMVKAGCTLYGYSVC